MEERPLLPEPLRKLPAPWCEIDADAARAGLDALPRGDTEVAQARAVLEACLAHQGEPSFDLPEEMEEDWRWASLRLTAVMPPYRAGDLGSGCRYGPPVGRRGRHRRCMD